MDTRDAHRDTERPVAVLAEDEPDVRDLIARVLADRGWTVYEASGGIEALRLFEEHRPVDLLITDVSMPHVDGLQLARIVRRQRPNQKILYITGYSDRIFDSRAVLPDNEAYLDKPFTIAGLLEAASLLVFGSTRSGSPDSPCD